MLVDQLWMITTCTSSIITHTACCCHSCWCFCLFAGEPSLCMEPVPAASLGPRPVLWRTRPVFCESSNIYINIDFFFRIIYVHNFPRKVKSFKVSHCARCKSESWWSVAMMIWTLSCVQFKTSRERSKSGEDLLKCKLHWPWTLVMIFVSLVSSGEGKFSC